MAAGVLLQLPKFTGCITSCLQVCMQDAPQTPLMHQMTLHSWLFECLNESSLQCAKSPGVRGTRDM